MGIDVDEEAVQLARTRIAETDRAIGEVELKKLVAKLHKADRPSRVAGVDIGEANEEKVG